MENPTETVDVAIVGAGLAGLAAAIQLRAAGRRPVVFEASDRWGGRVRTDHVDGFTLDHGFQVLLTEYPTCREMLDYDALRLRPFEPGARIHLNGRFHTLGDPWRRPATAWSTLVNPVGSLADKLRVAKLRHSSCRGTLEEVWEREHGSTERFLDDAGVSEAMRDHFFRPFLGGVFLDESLSVSRRMFEFVFRYFAKGDAAVPAGGMASIADQMADRLPRDDIRLQASVRSLDRDEQDRPMLELSNGQRISARAVLIATESNGVARLIGTQMTSAIDTSWNGAVTAYFSAGKLPSASRYLHLRGDDSGPIQSATVISATAPEYAPADRSLISVSVNPDADSIDWDDPMSIDAAVRPQVERWFDAVDLSLLSIYRVPFGVPARTLDPVILPCRASEFGGPSHVYLAGDHLSTPSIEGAMSSGVRAADAIASSGDGPTA